MMCKQMLINDIKNKFTELAPKKEISYTTMPSKKVILIWMYRNVYIHLDLTYNS